MVISSKEFDQIRQALADGKESSPLAASVTALSVAAAFECCCANWFWQMTNHSNGIRFFNEIQSRFPALRLISTALHNGRQLRRTTDAFTPFAAELYTLQNAADFSGDNFGLFQMRFSRSLEQNGFGKELGRAIAAALGEMADNIVQHSKQPSHAHGLVGYQVTSRGMCFAVADVGQGILECLSQSPKWKHLRTDREAISAAVCQGATSRTSAIAGTGFKQIHKALASYNGLLRFRSGKSVLTLSGISEPKIAIASSVADMGGFQLSVSCDLDKKGEKFLLDSFN